MGMRDGGAACVKGTQLHWNSGRFGALTLNEFAAARMVRFPTSNETRVYKQAEGRARDDLDRGFNRAHDSLGDDAGHRRQ